MLKELKQFKNLGTPAYFFELLQQLEGNPNDWTTKNVREYFFNRRIDGQSIFDGCLPFLEALEVISLNDKDVIIPDTEYFRYTRSIEYLSSKLLERFFVKCSSDDVFHSIFCSENISYDIIRHSIQISNSAFPFKYSNIRQMLVDFNFLQPHPDLHIKKLIINQKYKSIFDINVLPEIKKRKIGLDELQKQLDQKRIYGEEAEHFVLSYEHKRLENKKDPEWVAPYWANAGYDIASFEDASSIHSDRFIEVKSYSGNLGFYWSRNEIDVARVKKDEYFLYLVDRSKMSDSEYSPTIIKNPYEKIIRNSEEWEKRVEGYFISRL